MLTVYYLYIISPFSIFSVAYFCFFQGYLAAFPVSKGNENHPFIFQNTQRLSEPEECLPIPFTNGVNNTSITFSKKYVH